VGEARRRKQLDPSWGKVNRQCDAEKQADEVVVRVLSNPRMMPLNLLASTLIMGVLAPIDPRKFAMRPK
jgi:hypothetical protein